LHIGHAKSICLNFGIAASSAALQPAHGRHQPDKEDVEYVDSIAADVQWLINGWPTTPRPQTKGKTPKRSSRTASRLLFRADFTERGCPSRSTVDKARGIRKHCA